ncbi:beta-ketoacyl-[acyl-carrier-protein] synthase family protein [Confluentibacter flavum]|uniref:Beta-ketoacyl-[acyl-carrier-protein] synthase family protein n=1 Tax=Confluentibacter flavum TaxID=1909700 RepID=A0A2N3HKR1_9FLAO|nr:beta-ketoacyl-[acyl-carrier-protein] synthase family protein [Confluentibacter flavum]PKQ45482.1 beta-ketoacyl-[acyl-carrier-protein] synthase family protein [Confluentibacter flavum]
MTSPRVAITGMGIISAIGNTVEENKVSLFACKSGVKTIKNISTIHAGQIKVGEVKCTNETLISQLQLSSDNNFTRTALLGLIAAKEAVKNARILDNSLYKTGLISSTTVGGMDKTEQHLKQFKTSPESQKYISSHHASDSTKKMADYLGITDFTTTISTACSSSTNAIMLGARLIKSGKLDRVIVGGTDVLSKFTINGFKTLMILSDEICKPFDEHRKGLNLGEGAAYLVLEAEHIAKKEKHSILAFVSGYGNANDAFHQTASSENGQGAYLAMQKALDVAQLIPEQIDYINAHGTATANNDLSESIAIKRIFGEKVPNFSSTKAFTGHTLAASGAIEAVYSVLALQEQTVFPNLNFKSKIKETELIPTTEIKKTKIKHVLSNSFGFGGNCSTIIFSKE